MDNDVSGMTDHDLEQGVDRRAFRNVITTGHIMIFLGLLPIIASAFYIAFVVGISYSNLQSALAMETANRVAAESSLRNEMTGAFNALTVKIENSAALATASTENIKAALSDLKSDVKTLGAASTPSRR